MNNGAKPGCVKVKHREYIGDLQGSATSRTTAFNINPGLYATFPWLSQLALLYESYLFLSLKFEFETTASTSQIGFVAIAVDFDASDEAPVSKTQLLQYQGAVRTAPWESVEYLCTRENLRKFGTQRFIRSGNLRPNQDIKTYDIGNLFIITGGNTGNVPLGELYVTYEVELFTPQISQDLAYASSAKVVCSTDVSISAPFGSGLTSITGGLPITWVSGKTLRIDRPGEYLLSFLFEGTGILDTESSGLITGTSGSSTIEGIGLIFAEGSNQGVQEYIIHVTQPNQGFFGFPNGNLGFSTLTSTTVRISLYEFSNQ